MRTCKIDAVVVAQAQYVQLPDDKLREIALQEAPQVEPSNQPGRRVKSKKKK